MGWIPMLESFRRFMVALSARADAIGNSEDVRRLTAMAAKSLRRPGGLRGGVEGIGEMAAVHATEVSTWVGAAVLADSLGGPFDACDLPCWLVLAEKAGVPFVPAREILRLSEQEFSALSGSIEQPQGKALDAVRAGLGELVEASVPAEATVDRRAAADKLYAAMDGVPEGWMVRSARCGSSELKALAGVGTVGPSAPEVRFGPDLEVGPGWVRIGNRRRVHVSDRRTVESQAHGPGGDAVFLARPWVEAARYMTGVDPHRHGTPFAGKGTWPAEWRAFVERGEVVGVSLYYGWCGESSSENALIALEVRALAQEIVDAAKAMGAWPRYMDVEFARLNTHPRFVESPLVRDGLAAFPRDDVGCTLDFLETKDGLVFLEAGPGNTPFGGGHPCAFAGCGGQPTFGRKTSTVGVAFKTLPGVSLADPRTWNDTDRAACVLDWAEVEALATEDSPAPPAP
jgi:hypothetical protein